MRGEEAKGDTIVYSSVKLLIESYEVALGAGDVNRKSLMVRSSLAVAKYLFAGSNVMPLT